MNTRSKVLVYGEATSSQKNKIERSYIKANVSYVSNIDALDLAKFDEFILFGNANSRLLDEAAMVIAETAAMLKKSLMYVAYVSDRMSSHDLAFCLKQRAQVNCWNILRFKYEDIHNNLLPTSVGTFDC